MLTKNIFEKHLSPLLENFKEETYLLAISGGVDSMVLLHLFYVLGFKFQVAHVNYKLRGEDSDLDQKTVEDFCKKKQLTLHIYEVSETDKKPENSIQLWARNLRYNFFKKIQQEQKLEYLVTAHHLNDQLETFIINISRGSGIKGLIGIPENENKILRPLLGLSKDEIYAFAKENKVDFREDLSNHKNDYLRNKIRNKIVPELLETSPDFLTHFSDSLSYLKSANVFIQKEIDNVFREIIKKQTESEMILDKEKLLEKDSFIITEIIRKLGFSGMEINKVISAENGKFFRSKTHEIKITRNEILCQKKLEK